jgi:hypothetical protein
MFRWLNNEGFRADIGELRRRYPEIHLQTLEEWLRSEGWHKRARRVYLVGGTSPSLPSLEAVRPRIAVA